MEAAKRGVERSIDTLQRLYTVVVALAIGVGIKSLFEDRVSHALRTWTEVIPRLLPLLALVITLVPFVQGMGRHFDKCYLERPVEHQARGALLLDFATFFAQATLMFLAATFLDNALLSFAVLGFLLGVDMLWALVSHLIHYSKALQARGGPPPESYSGPARWLTINSLAIAVGLLLALPQTYSESVKSWV